MAAKRTDLGQGSVETRNKNRLAHSRDLSSALKFILLIAASVSVAANTPPPPSLQPETDRHHRKSCGCAVETGSDVIDCRNVESLGGCELSSGSYYSNATTLDVTGNRLFAGGRLRRAVLPSVALTHLRLFVAQRCGLTTVDSWTFNHAVFPQLRVIRLSDNEIISVGCRTFEGLSELVEVWLDGNRLERFAPRTFARLPRLRVLHLERNRFADVPSEGLAGSAVGHLHLDMNAIRRIDEHSLENLRLSVLTCAGNMHHLTVTPFALYEQNLDRLDLSNSGLNSILFVGHSNIRELDLSGNPSLVHAISRRQFAVGKPISVRKIELRHLDLRTIEATVFQGFSFLEEIDLSENRIETIDDDTFEATPRLKSLNLGYNHLEQLSESLFRHLETIEHLNLTRNMLEAMPVERLGELDYLQTLDLSVNHFQVIPEAMSAVIENISERGRNGQTVNFVDFSANPLHCNCELAWFQRWVRNYDAADRQRRHVCRTPAAVGGRPLVDVGNLACRVPRIVSMTSSTITAEGGRDTFLVCTADADPAPSVEWLSPRGETFMVLHISADRQRTRTTAIWKVKIGPTVRIGVFLCRARNVAGQTVNVTFVGLIDQMVTTTQRTNEDDSGVVLHSSTATSLHDVGLSSSQEEADVAKLMSSTTRQLQSTTTMFSGGGMVSPPYSQRSSTLTGAFRPSSMSTSSRHVAETTRYLTRSTHAVPLLTEFEDVTQTTAGTPEPKTRQSSTLPTLLTTAMKNSVDGTPLSGVADTNMPTKNAASLTRSSTAMQNTEMAEKTERTSTKNMSPPVPEFQESTGTSTSTTPLRPHTSSVSLSTITTARPSEHYHEIQHNGVYSSRAPMSTLVDVNSQTQRPSLQLHQDLPTASTTHLKSIAASRQTVPEEVDLQPSVKITRETPSDVRCNEGTSEKCETLRNSQVPPTPPRTSSSVIEISTQPNIRNGWLSIDDAHNHGDLTSRETSSDKNQESQQSSMTENSDVSTLQNQIYSPRNASNNSMNVTDNLKIFVVPHLPNDQTGIRSSDNSSFSSSRVFCYGIGIIAWIGILTAAVAGFIGYFKFRRKDFVYRRRYRVGPVSLNVMQTVTAICHIEQSSTV